MTMVRFRGLDKIGVVTDVPYSDLPVNAWTDALNVRFEPGRISKVGGWDIVSDASCIQDQTPFTVRKAPLSQGVYYFATNKFIYNVSPNVAGTADVRVNITPRDASSTGVVIPTYDVDSHNPAGTKVMHYNVQPNERWNTTMIANRLVMNAHSFEPISQEDGSTKVTDPLVGLKGWGVPNSLGANKDVKINWRCKRLHTFKDHLLALNMDESTSFATPQTVVNIPNRIRWSTFAFENQVPQNWYEDDEDGDGGFVDLMDATSEIVDGAVLRDYFMVYTNTETYLMTYVGGNDVFQNARVFNDSGILAPGCVTEYDGRHIVVTNDDVIIHDGSQKQSLIQGKIRDRLLSELSSVNTQAVRVYSNPIRREVWITYPFSSPNKVDITQFTCNRAAIYNFTSNTWSFADLPNVYDITMGELISSNPLVDWDDGTTEFPTDVAWDSTALPWETKYIAMGSNRLFAASSHHCLLVLDQGDKKYTPHFTAATTYTKQDDGYVQRYVERMAIDMDEVVEEIGRVKTWRTIYPQMQGEGDFYFNISGSNVLSGVLATRPESKFTVGLNYKVDLLWSKRYTNIRISTKEDSDWNFAGYDLDYVVEGLR